MKKVEYLTNNFYIDSLLNHIWKYWINYNIIRINFTCFSLPFLKNCYH